MLIFLIRDVDDQNDNQESVELKRTGQEEDDIDRIKEESRRRREAILQKYKALQSQQQQAASQVFRGVSAFSFFMLINHMLFQAVIVFSSITPFLGFMVVNLNNSFMCYNSSYFTLGLDYLLQRWSFLLQ